MTDLDTLTDNPVDALCSDLLDLLPTGHALREELNAVRLALASPLRVAVVGRVSAGKSTLVNALVGRRVAATAAEDCTRYPVVYREGAPESAFAVTSDGRRLPLSIQEALGGAPVAPGETVVRLEVALQSAVLHAVTLVDTPGLAATSPNALVADESRRLAAGAEVLLYLFRGIVRSDDARVIDELRLATTDPAGRTERAGLVCTIGLLAHADNLGAGGWGDDDPMELARAAAATTAATLPDHFTEVLPVSGLMAESVRTGRLTEADTRLLRTLRQAPASLLRFGASTGAAGVDAETLVHLGEVLTPYGLNYGRARSATSAELIEWLQQASGIRGIEEALHRCLVQVRHARTSRALQALTEVARRGDVPVELARRVEAFAHGPSAHVVREVRAERLLTREQPSSPLLGELRRWLSLGTLRERMDAVPADGDPAAWAFAQASRFQAESGTARTGAEAEAARTLAQSMLHLGQAVAKEER
ncbi:dynamin family protein [Terrabacter sp. GCM10028922]|uniref:dynamin family protein n=1 Tax=Terrabacter sp. GCM10028922 TaxID=3273428 RepID=UPI003617212F